MKQSSRIVDLPVRQAGCFVTSFLAMTVGMMLVVPSIIHAQSPDDISARAYAVLDEKTGVISTSRNADVVHPAASLTKLMSAVIFMEHRPAWNLRVKMLKADEVGGGRLRLRIGTVLTARDLFYAALVGSANNSANALMRISRLSNRVFIHEMNVRAAVFGLRHTAFRDASGMNPGNVTTARDMALLARYAFKNPDIGTALGTERYQFKPVTEKRKKIITNTNLILGESVGGVTITGGKTGYLEEADYNLVVRARDANGRGYLIVVLGAPGRRAAADDAQTLATRAVSGL